MDRAQNVATLYHHDCKPILHLLYYQQHGKQASEHNDIDPFENEPLNKTGRQGCETDPVPECALAVTN